MLSSGYVTDVPYPRTFLHHLAPAWLDVVALLGGQAPPERRCNFAWCELGCGQGVTAAILAATHREGAFHAVDLMPDHITSAQRLVTGAGITNLTLHCADFASAAASKLPAFDYIVIHGVYSWVSVDAQANLRRFIDLHLAPGGLVYVSYNAMPGCAAELAYGYLVRALAATAMGDSTARFAAADTIVERLALAGARVLGANATSAGLADARRAASSAYRAHEYLAPYTQPLYVTEVRRDMAGIGLHPVGSATFVENFDSFVLRRAERQALDEIADTDLRALARDYFLAQRFRRDVFSRNSRPMDEKAVRRAMLDRVFMLARPAEEVEYVQSTPAGSLRFDNPIARGIVNALADRPRRLGDIPLGRTALRDRVAGALALIAGRAILPVGPGSAPVARLNAALRETINGDPPSAFIALPCGTAFLAEPEVLSHLVDGTPPPSAMSARAKFLAQMLDETAGAADRSSTR